MKCENCGKNEANVKYTQIINGEKKQMFLCEDCHNKLHSRLSKNKSYKKRKHKKTITCRLLFSLSLPLIIHRHLNHLKEKYLPCKSFLSPQSPPLVQ